MALRELILMAVTGSRRKCRPASVNSELKPRRMGFSVEGKWQDGIKDQLRPFCDLFIVSNMLHKHKHTDNHPATALYYPFPQVQSAKISTVWMELWMTGLQIINASEQWRDFISLWNQHVADRQTAETTALSNELKYLFIDRTQFFHQFIHYFSLSAWTLNCQIHYFLSISTIILSLYLTISTIIFWDTKTAVLENVSVFLT